MAKKALGRGLSALLENADTDITGTEPEALHSIAEIKISQIIANPFQPRTEFDDEALEELSESIKVHGIIQPITVRKIGYEKYELISGERRFIGRMWTQTRRTWRTSRKEEKYGKQLP